MGTGKAAGFLVCAEVLAPDLPAALPLLLLEEVRQLSAQAQQELSLALSLSRLDICICAPG